MAMKKWKLIEETDVSPSKWFPIKKHKVELPNGTIIDDYFITTLGNVGMILPITKDNKIVLVKQYKHGVKDVLIELPAGFQQKGKTIEQSGNSRIRRRNRNKNLIRKFNSNWKNIKYSYKIHTCNFRIFSDWINL